MIHMLSAFNLKPGEDYEQFRKAYAEFVADILDAGIIESAGPLGHRVPNTPMDTDDRDQKCFSVMSFRDRQQLDAAYVHIERRMRPATATHLDMYRRITNSVFLCWEDEN